MMMRMTLKLTVAAVFLAFLAGGTSAECQRIAFWNVENYFDTRNDSIADDDAYTPTGENHWTQNRFKRKRDNIYKVVLGLGQPAIMGLAEVENDYVMAELVNGTPLRKKGYRYIHYDSPDHRGIDCALLYRHDLFSPVYSRAVNVSESNYETRDLLLVLGVSSQGDSIAVIVCHLPSKRGGATAERHRSRIAGILRECTDTLGRNHPGAAIVVMGDFNADRYETPFMQDFAFEPQHSNPEGLYNLMYTLPNDEGTHNYGGRWSCHDQIFYRPPQEAKNGDLPKVRIFKPEFLNRIDEILVFRQLAREDVRQILNLQLRDLADRVRAAMGFTLKVTVPAREYLMKKGFDPKYGARPLRRAIQTELEDPLALRILSEGADGPVTAGFDTKQQKIVFR